MLKKPWSYDPVEESLTFISDTILIQNDYKDTVRRSAEGDRKALCSPPQRRNPFATYERDDLETE